MQGDYQGSLSRGSTLQLSRRLFAGGIALRHILDPIASGYGTSAFIVLLGLGWLAGFLWF